MFKSVSPKLEINTMEKFVLDFWKKENIFKRSVDERKGCPEYVVFEGPPTANGKPGVHHVLARAFKDVFPRYKTMQGFRVFRRGGWDTHGLPVEIEVEKKLGFNNKQQIEEFGIAKFNDLCRQSAFANIQEWEKLTDRIAYWVDLNDAYITYKNEYIESVWWILKNFWEKELLYQDFKVVPYCPRCGTPLSDHEVALGYQEVEDPSIFVRMPLVDDPGTSLLVWTTTPWTLPGNVAVAVGDDIDYVTVECAVKNDVVQGKERLILAEAMASRVLGDLEYEIVKKEKGRSLVGKQYKPLFTFIPPDKPAHRVIAGDFVSIGDGSGLVHIAPAYGEDDMRAGRENDLPVLMPVAPNGTFIAEVRPWAGRFVKEADPFISDNLDARGLLFKKENYKHSYPFCWRCDTPLLYYARPTWYIRTSKFKKQLVALNQTINWYPDHIKNGRFGNWLENNIDWALGRERFWGTPLPVWQCQTCKKQICIGSVAELTQYVGHDLSGLDLHRPYVDEVTFDCPECQGTMKRVPELIDVWFDSGSMQVAQWHYPFENTDKFQSQFPADYICEAVDQTRGWFYSLHAIATLLFDSVSFKNVICLGLILDGEGQKMSKSKGNVADPWEVLDKHGADAMRWYLYTASPSGQERRFSADLVSEVVRNFMLTLWNTYSFFVTYANLDNWKPSVAENILYSNLDRWIRAELYALVAKVTVSLESYDVLGATRPIEEFVDHLSNWYLRRSRRRFWKSDSDADKHAAYATLYEVLLVLSKLLAPTMPFIAEEIFQNLSLNSFQSGRTSVHLEGWPAVDSDALDQELIEEMDLVMCLVSLGHAARNNANMKVRQPLREAAFALSRTEEKKILEKNAELLMEELNVKSVRVLEAAQEAAAYYLNPYPKQLGQRFKSQYPAVRQAILDLDTQSAALTLLSGKSVKIQIDSEEFDINPEEVEVRLEAKSGFAVAAEGGYLAALDVNLNDELIREGLIREFVRKVQDARKQCGFDIADHVDIWYTGTKGMLDAIERFTEYIKTETLCDTLDSSALPDDLPNVTDEINGESITIWIEKSADQ